MNKLSYIISARGHVSLVLSGKSYEIDQSHSNYHSIVEAVKSVVTKGADAVAAKLKDLVDVSTSIVNFSDGDLQVESGLIMYRGEAVDNYAVTRLFELKEQGFDYKPLANFLAKVLRNPSHRSKEQLYRFLENGKFPLTEDGDFLAYKAVTRDFKDKHTGKIDNSVGRKPKINRGDISDDPQQPCHKGLHAGNLDYVSGFGLAEDKTIIVKINPANVVCVPYDASSGKVRVCEYEVIGVLTDEAQSKFKGGTDVLAAKPVQPRDEYGRFMKQGFVSEQTDEEEAYYCPICEGPCQG